MTRTSLCPDQMFCSGAGMWSDSGLWIGNPPSLLVLPAVILIWDGAEQSKHISSVSLLLCFVYLFISFSTKERFQIESH